MSQLARWSVKNRVAVNLLTLTLLSAGIYTAAFRLNVDLFPDVSTNFITITTVDTTTSVPEDIERTITVPLEDKLSDVSDVSRLLSFSEDNISNIFIEIDPSVTDMQPILSEVRQAVDLAKGELPSSAEDPIVEEFDIPLPLVTFGISYPPDFDLRTVREELDFIERRLRQARGVSNVLVDGLQDRELWIEVDPIKLRGLGLSFPELGQMVARRNISTAVGRLDGLGGQRVARVLGQVQDASELEFLPVRQSDGGLVLLRDIATVKETTARAERFGRFNGQPAINYTIVKSSSADAIKTAEAARAAFLEATKALPDELTARVIKDNTRFIRTRVETVVKNGFQALLLVAVLLVLLLNWRLAVIVAIGLPVSFAGTFLVLEAMGASINMLSLFAMIMALGMVVDDAIVVAENVYRRYEEGLPPVRAAIEGVQEVFWPVVGSVSTTVAAFLPLIWGEGIIGKFLSVVPLVVISALVFSLVQAFLVLPSHISDFVRLPESTSSIRTRLRSTHNPFHWMCLQVSLTYSEVRAITERAFRGLTELYLYLLKVCLRWRYAAIAGFVALLVGSIVAVANGVIPFRLFATDWADDVLIKLEMPPDTTIQESARAVADLERRIIEVMPSTDVLAIISRVGAKLDIANELLEYGSNLAMITVDLNEQHPECRRPSEIVPDLRDLVAEFPLFTKIIVEADQGGPPVGAAVNAQIQGPELDGMLNLADRLEDHLRTVAGVRDIGNDWPRGKTEFQIVIDDDRANRVGLDVTEVAQNLQAAFRGTEVSSMRWGDSEITVRVKMDERYAHDPDWLRSFWLNTPQGGARLDSVAQIVATSGVARFKRLNRDRVITVSADVDTSLTTSQAVNEELEKFVTKLLEEQPGYRINLAGENEDTQRSMQAMLFAGLIAIALIYTLLATITNSFLQPLIIMAVIPFGFVGVYAGLIFIGQPMGLMGIMGMIALAGIVVNNSVVFVDFMNRYRHQHSRDQFADDEIENVREQPRRLDGLMRWRSIMVSGQHRFRPIVLTTATTVAGLLGLASTTSGQEQFLAPMAQAIVFGLSFATLITLILIPCLYAILDDAKAYFSKAQDES
ncbi:MAG: efflux RND transporter permease subunit [Verrucomicrobiales bacterium]